MKVQPVFIDWVDKDQSHVEQWEYGAVSIKHTIVTNVIVVVDQPSDLHRPLTSGRPNIYFEKRRSRTPLSPKSPTRIPRPKNIDSGRPQTVPFLSFLAEACSR